MQKLAFAVVACLSVLSLAQSNEKSSANPQSLMQAATAVKPAEFGPVTVIKNERLLSFDADGRLKDTIRSVYRIERAEELDGWGSTGIRYEPWHQSKPQISARVITPDGAVHQLDPKTITDAPAGDAEEDIFSDARRVDAPLPALVKGAIVEEELVVSDTQPSFAAGSVERIWFSRRVPVESTVVTVTHPQSLPLHYTAYLLPDLKVAKSVANGIETVIFTSARLEPDDSDLDNAPSGEPVYPQLAIATGVSWNTIAAAYAKATEPKIVVADVQSLVSDADRKLPRDERIAKLVDRLHKKVRYTGVEFGESSLIPQNAAETLKRQFGDCKDKATLLVTMLRAANVPAKLALLNADSIQAMPDLPGMAFDHAIVYVPAGDGGTEYWIDATSAFSTLGSLPYDDYGRAALIVDEQTFDLTTIPQLRSADNVQTETRLFELAEDGPSRIVETDQNSGPSEAQSRNYAFTRTKETRDAYQKYVREAYLSEKLGELKFGDPTDMAKSFTVTIEALKAPRGGTDFERAVVAILPFDITDGLPNALRYEQDKEKKAKTRRVDFQFYPSVRVWRYDIHPPMGYKPGTLPPNSERSFGTAKLTQKYEVLPDGRIQATLTFDTGKGRLTPAEAEQMRTTLAELRNASAILVGFDSEPLALVNAGKVKEGLAKYQQLIAAHPKEALHRTQLAAALINLGLGGRARTVAQQAIQLEPKSGKAHLVYAQVLERDLIGRRFGRGFDYQGAIAEYRAAKVADPEDKDLRASLAILLEHDPAGDQYGKGSQLAAAVQEWAELKKLDQDYADGYVNNVLFDLWYLDRNQELQDRLASVKSDDTRRQLLVASIARSKSGEAAVERAHSLASDRRASAQLLIGAALKLLKRRFYAPSAALYSAAARDLDSPAQILTLAATLEKTAKTEDQKLPLADPVGALAAYSAAVSDESVPLQQALGLWSKKLSLTMTPKQLQAAMVREREGTLAAGRNAQLGAPVLMDLAFSGAKFTKEGDDAGGYKVSMQFPSAPTQHTFLIKEDGAWKVVGEGKQRERLGAVVIDALERGDSATARRWLDWAREVTSAGGSLDDPLSGELFARFWTKGQQADDLALRRAAIALVHETAYAKKIADKMPELFSTTNPAEQPKFLLIRAAVAENSQRWAEVEPLSAELLKLFPESKVAAGFTIRAALQLKHFALAESTIKPFAERDPRDRWVASMRSMLEQFRGDFDAAQKVLVPVIEDGTATPADLNSYAWLSLFTKAGVDKAALDAGERGTNLSKNNYAIMHTVACQYAEIGRGREGYKLLMDAMKAISRDEPLAPDWYALARIAESYGESEGALAMYKKVEHDEDTPFYPTDTYLLAERGLKRLSPASGTSAAKGAK